MRYCSARVCPRTCLPACRHGCAVCPGRLLACEHSRLRHLCRCLSARPPRPRQRSAACRCPNSSSGAMTSASPSAHLAGSGTLGPSDPAIDHPDRLRRGDRTVDCHDCSWPGCLPGAMLCVLFMGYVAVWALLNRSKMPATGREQCRSRRSLSRNLAAAAGHRL